MIVRSHDLVLTLGTPDPTGEAEAWGHVLRELPRLRRWARRAATFRGVDPEDVLHELCADLVESRRLYDPARGPWIVWAKTRSRLAILRGRRLRDRHEPAGRAAVGRGWEEGEAGVNVDPELGVGRYGSAARSEAAVDACLLYRRSSGPEREVAVCLLLGLDAERMTGLGRDPRTSIVAGLRGRRWFAVESGTGLRLRRGPRGLGWAEEGDEALGFRSVAAARAAVRRLDPDGARGLRVVPAST